MKKAILLVVLSIAGFTSTRLAASEVSNVLVGNRYGEGLKGKLILSYGYIESIPKVEMNRECREKFIEEAKTICIFERRGTPGEMDFIAATGQQVGNNLYCSGAFAINCSIPNVPEEKITAD